jgi:soluble lytic murein transglycosylase
MKYLRGKLLLCLVVFSGAVFGTALDQQRNNFLQAEKLLAQGNSVAFMRISDTLIDYPLYPYLQYQWLKDNLQQTNQVLSYLESYKNTRYADLLRSKWLDYLAKNDQWSDFVRYYEASENTALECQYNLAI